MDAIAVGRKGKRHPAESMPDVPESDPLRPGHGPVQNKIREGPAKDA